MGSVPAQNCSQIVSLSCLDHGVGYADHYLDDYIAHGPPNRDILCYLDTMLSVYIEVGFAINPEKVVGPSSVIEFLEFILDTMLKERMIFDWYFAAIMDERQ